MLKIRQGQGFSGTIGNAPHTIGDSKNKIQEEDEAQPSSPVPSITSKTRSKIQLNARALGTINDVKSKIKAEAKAEIAGMVKFCFTIDTVKSKIQVEPLPVALVLGNSQMPTQSMCIDTFPVEFTWVCINFRDTNETLSVSREMTSHTGISVLRTPMNEIPLPSLLPSVPPSFSPSFLPCAPSYLSVNFPLYPCSPQSLLLRLLVPHTTFPTPQITITTLRNEHTIHSAASIGPPPLRLDRTGQ